MNNTSEIQNNNNGLWDYAKGANQRLGKVAKGTGNLVNVLYSSELSHAIAAKASHVSTNMKATAVSVFNYLNTIDYVKQANRVVSRATQTLSDLKEIVSISKEVEDISSNNSDQKALKVDAATMTDFSDDEEQNNFSDLNESKSNSPVNESSPQAPPLVNYTLVTRASLSHALLTEIVGGKQLRKVESSDNFEDDFIRQKMSFQRSLIQDESDSDENEDWEF